MRFGLRPPLPSVVTLPDIPDGMDGSALPDAPVYGGAASVGEAAAYSQVWEWGNVRQTQKGPKTVMGINPDGQRIWLTIQAPYGYVRINSPQFGDSVLRNMLAVDPLASSVLAQIKSAAAKAAQEIASLIRDTAPVDTGALSDSIQAVGPDDSGLVNVDHWSEGSPHAALDEE